MPKPWTVGVNEVTFGHRLGRSESARTVAFLGQWGSKSEREVALGPTMNLTRDTVMSMSVNEFNSFHTNSVRLGSKGRDNFGDRARAVTTLR
jgi:hypothetical protein